MRYARFATAVSVALAVTLYGVASADTAAAAFLLVLLLIALLLRSVRVEPGPELILLVLCPVAAFAWTLIRSGGELRPLPGFLLPIWSIPALAAIAALAMRLFIQAPRWGHRGTFVLLTAALMACGAGRFGAVYSALTAGSLGAAVLGMRLADPGRAALPAWKRENWVRVGAALALSCAVAVLLARTLPPLYDLALRASLPGGARSGMSLGGMTLGSVHDFYQSDAVVLRVHGGRTDHLRGDVLIHYAKGTWNANLWREIPPAAFPSTFDAGTPVIEVRREITNVHAHFLPLGVRAARCPPADIQVDADGILAPPAGEPPGVVLLFQVGPRPAGTRPADPTPNDLAVPEDLAPRLSSLADEWVPSGSDPAAALRHIRQRLETGYRYSLEFDRGKGDPVVDFLFSNRQGHCEYFASAMALLARSAGIPARVVTGYRVVEENAVGGYWVVRERHAHAWVEAHLQETGWVTCDPSATAPGFEMPTRTPYLAAILDAARTYAGWALSLALDRKFWVAGIAALLLVAGGALRALALLWKRRPAASTQPACAPPLPAFVEFLSACGRAGIVRERAETLARFADRLGMLGGEPSAEAVRAYAALRYGGVGREADVSEALRTAAKRLPVLGEAIHVGKVGKG